MQSAAERYAQQARQAQRPVPGGHPLAEHLTERTQAGRRPPVPPVPPARPAARPVVTAGPPGRRPSGGRRHVPDSGRQVASLVAVSVLAVAVLLGFVLLRVYRQHQRPDAGPNAPAAAGVAVGGCVAQPGQDLLQPVACDAPDAAARVLAALPASAATATGAPECPAQTDSIASPGGTTLCLVNLRAPHPGAAGAGGGVIRPGDCIANPGGGRTVERPCAQPGNYATVTARVDKADQCRAPAAEAVGLQVAAHPVACLRPRAKPGDCLGASRTGTPDVVPCTQPGAVGKLVGRAANGAGCPLGTVNRVNASNGLPAARVLCLAAVR